MANNTAGDTQAEAANFSGDDLGYSVYAQTLWARIEAALNKDLNRASPVGLFEPNPLGLCDLSGSVLEWQSNSYTPDSSGQDKVWVTDAVKLKTHDDFDQCDRPALRGGAWRYPAVSAYASFRFMHPPDIGLNDVGFRVALSLAE